MMGFGTETPQHSIIPLLQRRTPCLVAAAGRVMGLGANPQPNPNLEIQNPKQIQSPKPKMFKLGARHVTYRAGRYPGCFRF